MAAAAAESRYPSNKKRTDDDLLFLSLHRIPGSLAGI